MVPAEDVLTLLPHRAPMLMVDRVLELREDGCTALKNISHSEPCFQGHFPGNPIFPGVLIIEALAQTCALWLNRDGSGMLPIFAGIASASFRRKVQPGDRLRFADGTLRRVSLVRGSGAFSGKDPSKVDRSACYAARYVAKNLVAAGLADECEVALAYAIGVAQPVSVQVSTFGTGKLPEDELGRLVRKHFDLSPDGIIRMLDLRRPIYRQTAAYGHFGRTDIDLPWEHTDKAELLRQDAAL